MDADHVDTIIRLLGRDAHRRCTLGAVLAAGLGIVAPGWMTCARGRRRQDQNTVHAEGKKRKKRKKRRTTTRNLVSPPPVPPSPGCAGCRDGSGGCVPLSGQSRLLCGRDNRLCVSCGNGQVCENGVCGPDLPRCLVDPPPPFWTCNNEDERCIDGYCCKTGDWFFGGQVCGPEGHEYCCGPTGVCMADGMTCCSGKLCRSGQLCCPNSCTGPLGSYCA
jgi:hypothetical protein